MLGSPSGFLPQPNSPTFLQKYFYFRRDSLFGFPSCLPIPPRLDVNYLFFVVSPGGFEPNTILEPKSNVFPIILRGNKTQAFLSELAQEHYIYYKYNKKLLNFKKNVSFYSKDFRKTILSIMGIQL